MALLHVDTDILIDMRQMLVSMEEDLDHYIYLINNAMFDFPAGDSRTMNQAYKELRRYIRRCTELADTVSQLSAALKTVAERIEDAEHRLISIAANNDFL